MKKINASSDKKISGEEFLPSETLWRAAQLIRTSGVTISPLEAEPTPQEMLGFTIGILRRQKHISHKQFAQRIGCSLEELLALEVGLLPMDKLQKYLPLILKEIKLPMNFKQLFLRNV